MTGADFHRKTEAQAQRLIHSVNAVTDLLKANTELRDQGEKMSRELEDKEADNVQLQFENQQLRERLELLENILKNNSNQLDNLLTSEVKSQVIDSNTKYGRFSDFKKTSEEKVRPEEGMSVDDVYNELILLRQQNRVLGDRIKHLEV